MKNKINFANLKKTIFAFLFFVITFSSSFALTVPELTGPVVDQANLLSVEQYNLLDSRLRAISDESSTQIAVLTIPSLEGVDLEVYSMQVADEWKIGSKEKDDGVILLVAFKEKKIRIETGYGVEGSLTDAKSGLIIRSVMAPKFQQGEYGQGIIDAVDVIAGVIGVGDVSYATQMLNAESDPDDTAIPIVIFFVIFYIIMVSGALATKFPGLRWLPWYFLFKGNSSGNYRHYSGNGFGGYSGSSGFGSGFSGGFSGGGGGFGGGGASGGW